MKSYDETTNDLLKRRDRYVTEQKHKRKKVISIATSVCCLLVITIIGLGVWQSELFVPDKILEDAIYPGVKDYFDESKGESPDNLSANNKIIINAIDGVSADRMNIALMIDDFVEMTLDEMIAYYGVDFIPEVPADINPWPENERCGIYKRNGGTGEVYWDAEILNYSNEDFTREVFFEVDKGSKVFVDWRYFEGTEEKSVINNCEVLIGLSENGCYYSEFMYKGVGFLIDAQGVTEDEFVAIIASVIE